MLIEVQTLDNRQLRIAITEIDSEAVGLRPFWLFQQITVCLHLLECQQCDIVRIEMSVGHSQDIINVQGIFPYRILTDIRFTRRLVSLMRISHHLTLLIEDVVTISILQRIDPILAWSHALDDKTSTAVGS